MTNLRVLNGKKSNEPVKELIAHLEMLLDKAKSGELRSAVICGHTNVREDHGVMEILSISPGYSTALLVLSLERARLRILTNLVLSEESE